MRVGCSVAQWLSCLLALIDFDCAFRVKKQQGLSKNGPCLKVSKSHQLGVSACISPHFHRTTAGDYDLLDLLDAKSTL